MSHHVPRDSVDCPSGTPPRQRYFLSRNPLIPVWFLLILATLLVADGGGTLFVLGASLTLLTTVLIAHRAARSLIGAIRRALPSA